LLSWDVGGVGRVICIANQKGGVGKTTTAVNLAASLALAHHDVLLVDIDPQGSASSGLGIREVEGGPSTYELLAGECSAGDLLRPSPVERLHVLPAGRDLVGAEVELVSALAREYRLKEGLHPIRDRYEFILIDCPPSLGLLTINSLTAADSVLIPLQCEYYALEGLTALNETIQLIRERLNPNLVLAGVLLTMFDSRNSLSHQVAEEVRGNFPGRVFSTVIPRNVRLSEAPSHGLPVALYDPSSRGAQAYVELVSEIIESESSATEAAHGLEGGQSDGGS
jgi:chromosome partitioning protein